MAEESKSRRGKSPEGIKIFAYGFDAADFTPPGEPITLTNIGRVEFIPFDDGTSLDTADGVIIPQGIFEELKRNPRYSVPWYDVGVNEPLLLDRERQVVNLLREGKWVCFLIGKIVDKVPHGFDSFNIEDTDLCKKILNQFGVKRGKAHELPPLEAKENEFILYVRDYGVAQTVLEFSSWQEPRGRVIVAAGKDVVGVEFLRRGFFLPFHTTRRDASAAGSIARAVAQAIFDYRQKRIVEIPAWVDEFQFGTEQNLRAKIGRLVQQTNKLQSQLESWSGYKAILTTSGKHLKNSLVSILEDFFDLKIDPIDENREDAKIIDEDGSVLAMIEAKGTNKGIKREYVNQVDSHRERNELPTSIPGVLLINNEMSIAEIDKRLETKVPDEQIKHAKNFNILIVRTIDLLFLMRHLEDSPDRKDELMRILLSGGGWLRADSDGYELVVG